MRRVIAIFLPTWPTDRLRRRSAAGVPTDRPLITAANDGRRQIVAAADAAACALGLWRGMPLAQAQAMEPGVTVVPADPDGDADALAALAGWCLRFAPHTAPDRPDGVWIDATGAAHLSGGEAALLGRIVAGLAGHGIAARAAMADTPGAAWALARHGAASAMVAPVGGAGAVLRPLSLAALRLPKEMVADLARLGLEDVGQLLDAPRAPLVRRFGALIARRLDQALGRIDEPIEAVLPPDVISSRLTFLEPLLTREALAGVIGRLAGTACAELEKRGLGARRLALVCERVDRTPQTICIGTASATRQPAHLAKLLEEKLEEIEPGFGIEAMRLTLTLVEPFRCMQTEASLGADHADTPELAVLVDRLSNRLGARRVYRVASVESDVPERSVRRVPPMARGIGKSWPKDLPRPVRLLRRPQCVEATAMLPDHPPAQFIWRQQRHRVRRADGPERIAGEWWKRDPERAAIRDYWQVEDEEGRRFWLYRSGDAADPATGDLRWFLHGFF